MGIIPQNDAYLAALRNLVEPEHVLKRHGFTLQLLTEEELLLKRRCLMCGRALSQLANKKSKHYEVTPKDAHDKTVTSVMSSTLSANRSPLLPTKPPASNDLTIGGSLPHPSSASRPDPVLTFRCNYHPGQVVQKYWTCCSRHVSDQPCGGSDEHNLRSYAPGELTAQYQFHVTPKVPPGRNNIRAAVSIDCEMGTAVSGDSELIRVTLIDYFTGAVLVNNIVEPDVPMQHLNTQYSGVTWADMSKAKRKGTCLGGKTRAREALWRYVGPETVVVGHGVSNDLRALRWIHPLVVDSFVTELTIMKRKEAEEEDQQKTSAGAESEGKCKASNHGETSVLHTSAEIPNTNGNEPVTKTQRNKGRERGSLSLKTLVKNRLDRDIQMRGNQGHDSLEDATAARDLIHWIITNPDSERLFWGHKLAVGIILELDNV